MKRNYHIIFSLLFLFSSCFGEHKLPQTYTSQKEDCLSSELFDIVLDYAITENVGHMAEATPDTIWNHFGVVFFKKDSSSYLNIYSIPNFPVFWDEEYVSYFIDTLGYSKSIDTRGDSITIFDFYGFRRRGPRTQINIVIQDHLGGDTYLYKKCKENIDTARYIEDITNGYIKYDIIDGFTRLRTYKYDKDSLGIIKYEKLDTLIKNY